jgi:hypothetical protein
MIFEGGVVGVIVGMHGVGADWEVLKRTSIEHPIAVHVVGACGPPVPRRASTMASYSPLGSPVFPWSRFLRYSYRWRPGKTSDTTTHTYTTGGPNWDVKEPLLSIRILVPCKSLKQTAKNGDNSTFQNCKLPLASFLLL